MRIGGIGTDFVSWRGVDLTRLHVAFLHHDGLPKGSSSAPLRPWSKSKKRKVVLSSWMHRFFANIPKPCHNAFISVHISFFSDDKYGNMGTVTLIWIAMGKSLSIPRGLYPRHFGHGQHKFLHRRQPLRYPLYKSMVFCQIWPSIRTSNVAVWNGSDHL